MIHAENLRFRAGAFELRDVSLHVNEGEYFVLLGPTGSGKTVFLECLCGLNAITNGRVSVGGQEITERQPRERGIGYLPQDYALFPHLTVLQNILFGPHRLGRPEEEAGKHAAELMERLSIAHLADRYPLKLSGGEKQRTALARALAIGPKALLLDEPVSALDEATRDRVCRELRAFQKSTGTTTLHVCHSFAEMLAVADRVAIVDGGRIVQTGKPREVLDRPATARIARFVQAGNLLPAVARPANGCTELDCGNGLALLSDRSALGNVTAVLRPERLFLTSAADGDAEMRRLPKAALSVIEDLGPCVRLVVTLTGGLEVQAMVGRRECDRANLAPGIDVTLGYRPCDVHVVNVEND
jgi:molybdate transport system ATP-binding protein/molybdate/tungstate transport system ATP-binding protein